MYRVTLLRGWQTAHEETFRSLVDAMTWGMLMAKITHTRGFITNTATRSQVGSLGEWGG